MADGIDSESDIDRERVRQAAKIQPVAGEILIGRQVPLCRLVAQFAADAPGTNRYADAAKHHRSGRRPAAVERALEDRIVGREKLSRLAVVVVEHANAAAD